MYHPWSQSVWFDDVEDGPFVDLRSSSLDLAWDVYATRNKLDATEAAALREATSAQVDLNLAKNEWYRTGAPSWVTSASLRCIASCSA